MIKLSFCLTKKDELSLEEFQNYWLNNHAPLVKQMSNDLKIVKYTQLHCRNHNFLQQNKLSRLNNAEIPKEYDGIAEIYWNSWDDLEGLADIENARMASKILMEDEAKFIKFSESPLLFSDIYEIIN